MKIIFTALVLFLLTNISGALATVDGIPVEELCAGTGGIFDSDFNDCVCPEENLWMNSYGCVISSSSGVDYSENYSLIVALGSLGIVLMVFLYVGLMYRR
jgi:hypothetical protein